MSCRLQGMLETYLNIGSSSPYSRSPGTVTVRPRCTGTASPEPIPVEYSDEPMVPLHLPPAGLVQTVALV